MAKNKKGEPAGIEQAKQVVWRDLVFSVDEVQARQNWQHLKTWLLVAFALRAAVALAGDFVIHPDEIMQYLEPAHAAVFGNGIIHWEYFYGARSWLVPGFVAILLWLSDLVGLGEPWFYVKLVKLSFCLVSLLVPWGIYQFCRYRLNEDVARIALVLACLWPFIAGYAHKPFTEYVATSLLFAALGLAAAPSARLPKTAAAVGFLIALAALMRMQYAPAAALIWLAFAVTLQGRGLVFFLLGNLATVVFVGALETATWGAPFHSYYTNFLFNLEFNQVRKVESNFFYLPRLVYATAGSAILSFFMMAKQPRRHLLVIALTAVVLALHMSQVHGEMRFIFLLLPLLLIPLADFIATSLKLHKEKLMLAIPATATSLFAVLALGNYLPGIVWLNKAYSEELGEMNFIRNQSNVWDIYRYLAAEEDVAGVLHLGHPYFNTPGYYHLHKKIPFYDFRLIKSAGKLAEGQKLDDSVSHIVVFQLKFVVDGFEVIWADEKYSLLRSKQPRPVRQFKDYRIHETTEIIEDFAAKILDAPPKPPALEFL